MIKLSTSNFWTITGDELVQRWGVDASTIEQFMVDDFFPVRDSKSMEIFNFLETTPREHIYWLKKYITEGPFTRFQFRPSDIESFEAQYGDFLEEMKNTRIAKKEQGQGEKLIDESSGGAESCNVGARNIAEAEVSRKTQLPRPTPPALQDGNTIVRKAQAMAIANAVKIDLPNLTIKEAALEINARLASIEAFDKDGKTLMKGYSVKHLMKIIMPLGFTKGKPGRISKK